MVNLKDIAKECNVSIATVSRALNNRGPLKAETKERILSKAEEMGYITDRNAKILKKGKSNTIGIIISDIENYFYNLILKQLIIEFEKLHYKVLISYSFENSDIEKENIISMLESKVDALIFTPISNKNEQLIQLMIRLNLPLLQLFRQAYPYVDAICVDDGYGAYLATKHFLNQDLKRIMLASVKLDFTPSRSKGYIKAYEEAGVHVNRDLICRFPLGISVYKQLKQRIQTDKIDAIIAGTNVFGSEIIKIMDTLKVKIPLIVFDEMFWLESLHISTIKQPLKEIYKAIISNIMTKLNDKNFVSPMIGENVRIKPTLIIRESSQI